MSISEKWHGLDLTDDQLEMLNLVRDFCAKEVRPNGAQYHLSQKTPTAILKKAAQCDFTRRISSCSSSATPPA